MSLRQQAPPYFMGTSYRPLVPAACLCLVVLTVNLAALDEQDRGQKLLAQIPFLSSPVKF